MWDTCLKSDNGDCSKTEDIVNGGKNLGITPNNSPFTLSRFPCCVFNICSFDICHETPLTNTNIKNMKIKFSWSTPPLTPQRFLSQGFWQASHLKTVRSRFIEKCRCFLMDELPLIGDPTSHVIQALCRIVFVYKSTKQWPNKQGFQRLWMDLCRSPFLWYPTDPNPPPPPPPLPGMNG